MALKANLQRTVQEIPIATLRQWLAVEKGKLMQWAHLQQHALQIAVTEINALGSYRVKID